MITEWLISLGTGITSWLGGLMSDLDLPEELTSSMTSLTSFLEDAAQLGIWTPWQAIQLSAVATLGVFGVAAAAMGVRQAAKHIPFIGGGG